MVSPMSATMPATWFCARRLAARTRSSLGKIAPNSESNEKNTDVAMQARNITHRIAFLMMTRPLRTYGSDSSPPRLKLNASTATTISASAKYAETSAKRDQSVGSITPDLFQPIVEVWRSSP